MPTGRPRSGLLHISLFNAAKAPLKKYFSPNDGLSFCNLDCDRHISGKLISTEVVSPGFR